MREGRRKAATGCCCDGDELRRHEIEMECEWSCYYCRRSYCSIVEEREDGAKQDDDDDDDEGKR